MDDGHITGRISTTTAALGQSAYRPQTTVRRSPWSSFRRSTRAAEAKMEPNLMMKVVGDHAPARGLPVKHPMMHRTRTVDYAVILSGEIEMMLDDTIVHVRAGDVIIQQATNHAWINRGTEPCRILFVLIDSKQP
jgi:mannose-6-phosphate isomerase-like protein (cupin superfamily)